MFCVSKPIPMWVVVTGAVGVVLLVTVAGWALGVLKETFYATHTALLILIPLFFVHAVLRRCFHTADALIVYYAVAFVTSIIAYIFLKNMGVPS